MQIAVIEDDGQAIHNIQKFAKSDDNIHHYSIVEEISQRVTIVNWEEIMKQLSNHCGELLLFLDIRLNLSKEVRDQLRSKYLIPTAIDDNDMDGVAFACAAIGNMLITRLVIILATSKFSLDNKIVLIQFLGHRCAGREANIIIDGDMGTSLAFEYKKAKTLLNYGIKLWHDRLLSYSANGCRIIDKIKSDCWNYFNRNHYGQYHPHDVWEFTKDDHVADICNMITPAILDELRRELANPLVCGSLLTDQCVQQMFSPWLGGCHTERGENLYLSVCLAKSLDRNALPLRWIRAVLGLQQDRHSDLCYIPLLGGLNPFELVMALAAIKSDIHHDCAGASLVHDSEGERFSFTVSVKSSQSSDDVTISLSQLKNRLLRIIRREDQNDDRLGKTVRPYHWLTVVGAKINIAAEDEIRQSGRLSIHVDFPISRHRSLGSFGAVTI